MSTNTPDAHLALFEKSLEDVPEDLKRATLRLDFTPSYVVVGVYRLFTDRTLLRPAWDKCKHAARRGAIVGAVWAFFTFSLQRKFVEVFLSNSPRIIGLSDDTFFGYKMPFSLYTYAAAVLVGNQITTILRFFLSKNIRIARDRAWDQTVASRGKGTTFWQPYVEEWENPPKINVDKSERMVKKVFGSWFGLFMVKRVLLSPFQVYPLVGIVITAWFKALGLAHILHRRYFEAKKMTPTEVAVFMEERKWDYRMFGFAASLLESIPIVGLVFTISNRIGAAMWAFDLEKRQHHVAVQRREGVYPSSKDE